APHGRPRRPPPRPPAGRGAGRPERDPPRGEGSNPPPGRAPEEMTPSSAPRHDVILLTCAGTGALEAAVVNTLSPGDPVLAVTMGAFGDRFAAIAETYGAAVTRLGVDWGTAADPAAVRDAAAAIPALKAGLLTHNETSTGVTNDVAALAAAVREVAPDALVLVDAISAMGAVPFAMDAWGLDVVVTGSQKAWMSAPGMAMAALSQRGWAATET